MTKEKILRFEEMNGKFEGFRVITDKQTIEFGIDSGQACCEQYGHFSTPDDLSDFVNADLLGVKVVDEALKSTAVTEEMGWDDKDVSVLFVNLETSNGTLQFTAYNSHNGYYGHTAFVKSSQVTEETCL